MRRATCRVRATHHPLNFVVRFTYPTLNRQAASRMRREPRIDQKQPWPPRRREVDMGASRRQIWAVCGLLVLAVGLVFGQTVTHEFVNYDDPDYVYKNAYVKRGLSVEGVVWAFTHRYAWNWHPLTWMSHMLDCQAYGLWAGGHHLTSVLIHAATAVGLFLLLTRMTGRLWRSATVAALFAIHPLRVESVAWVAERKDVLSGLLFLLTLGAYAVYCRRDMDRRVPINSLPVSGWSISRLLLYLLLVVLFALGLMAKPMLVTLPCVLLLLDYWPLGRFVSTRAWKLILEKLPLLALSIASCMVTLWAQTEAQVPIGLLSPSVRLANIAVAYVGYLGHFFHPLDLAVFYPHPGIHPPTWKVIASAIVLLSISAAAVAWRRKYPYLFVGWLWYLGMLLPVIGLVQVGGQATADRYTYLPQIGITIILVWGAADLSRYWSVRPAIAGIVSALVVASLTLVALLQTTFWRNSETLWKHALACTSDNCFAREHLADALAEMERTDEAITEYQAALQIWPDVGYLWVKAAMNLDHAGRFDEALVYYEKALHAERQDPLAFVDRGKAPAAQTHAWEATNRYQAVVHYSMGVALGHAGRICEAVAHYETALQLQPVYPHAHFNLATALAEKGEIRNAISHYEQASRQEPEYVKAHQNMAWLLATADPAQGGDSEKAVIVAQRAAGMAGGNLPLSLDVLAAAYASAGRFPEAVATARKGIQAASTTGDAALARQIEARLELYRQGRAYREVFTAQSAGIRSP